MRVFSVYFFVIKFIAQTLVGTILLPIAFAHSISAPEKAPIPLANPCSSATKEKPKNSFKSVNTIPYKNATVGDTITLKQLKNGLDSLSNNNIAKTIAIRNSMAKHSLNRQILTWAISTSNQTNIPSSEILSAINELQGWPSITIMQHNAERSFVNETTFAQAIIQKFAHRSPLTAEGMAALAKALITTGQIARAHQIVAPWWHQAKLNKNEEELILKNAGAVLKPADHLQRMKTMLYAFRIDSARRIASLARAESLFNAFVAVEQNDPKAAKKLQAVHQSWANDPILQFVQIRHLRRNGHYSSAAKLMMKAPRNVEHLINPDAWWIERRALSREMLDLKKPNIAYQLAANHIGTTPALAVDAEFHAGWYALRFLHEPKLAMRHFKRITQLASAPLSLSRGYYWMGRTAEILGEHKNAQHYFHNAAYFNATYYGQLAAARLNLKNLEISFPKPTNAERQRFNTRIIVQAIQRLESIDYANFAKILYKELGKKIESPGELALLAIMAEKKSDYYTSLIIGKTAVFQGKKVGALSHPIGAIPKSANISATGKALVYAIARQESEFNPMASSKAGAKGILQLLPTTAKELANKHSITWSQKKFNNDASYNAMLGAYFLNEQLERFNGSYILAFIGYNAGPRRVKEWIERYGDPRGQPLETVIDWIERIPYTETRNYVMRVMENYGVYKARLIGTTDIKTDLVIGHKGQ